VALLEGVREHHSDAFSVVLQMMEQEATLGYQDCVTRMETVANRLELSADGKAAKAKVAKAKKSAAETERLSRSPVKDRTCWDFAKFGGCHRSPCPFAHTGTPGTARCDKCKGKHGSKFCPNAPREEAKVAAASAAGVSKKAAEEIALKVAEKEKELTDKIKAKYKKKYQERSNKEKSNKAFARFDSNSDSSSSDSNGYDTDEFPHQAKVAQVGGDVDENSSRKLASGGQPAAPFAGPGGEAIATVFGQPSVPYARRAVSRAPFFLRQDSDDNGLH
jgi:hypothetical protein